MKKLDVEDFAAMGYEHVLKQSTGEWAAVMPQIYTTGLFVGLTDYGYERRYCYENYSDAFAALIQWDGKGDPPGPWLKEKPSDRLGPGLTEKTGGS